MPEGPTEAARQARTRRLDLDRAKGIAMLLVVFGHLVAGASPEGAGWYDQLRYAIYRFHMPFFLYLSGYVAMLAGAAATPASGWAGLARRRAARLLVPFLLVGLLIILGKIATAGVLLVDDPPEGLGQGLWQMLVWTEDSPATMIWYLWVLFLCSVLVPPMLALGIGTTGLVLLGLALQLVPLPPLAYLDRFGSHFVFFAIGCWVARREGAALPVFDRWQVLWWAALLAALAAALAEWLTPAQALLLCGILAVPALHGAVRLPPVSRWDWPLFLGRYSMVIYLFNTIAIGLAKAMLVKAGLPWDAAWLPVHLPLLMAAGIFLPVLGKVLVLRRIPPLDRMTD
jgi:fucose 4-O-acetylase-like acetyltransferase